MSGRLFGTDGVRGRFGEWPLTVDFIRRLGWAAGRVLAPRGRGRLLLVRDTRGSGAALSRALADGLGRAGVHVADGGVLPTPAVAALAPRFSLAGGAVISASHNPAEFNGVKLFTRQGLKLEERRERAIEKLALGDTALPKGRAKWEDFPEARRRYLAFLRRDAPSLRGLQLVVDCANGATARIAPALFRALGARVRALFASPDGKNINRGCGAVHPEVMAKAVTRYGADLGVAFDGDGDRAIFSDETGRIQDGNAVLVAAARHWQAGGRLHGNRVVATVMANLGFFRAMEALGVSAETAPVGDKFVWERMKKTGAVLGGEPSGHVIFRDYLSTGDGILTALRLLSIMGQAGRPLSTLVSLGVHYPQVLLNVPVREKRPLEKIPGFASRLAEIEKQLGRNGRTVIRYSGTEPLLRIMIEGPDRGQIQAQAESLSAMVKKYN